MDECYALDLGIPANAIAEAVFARCVSALKEERVAAAKKLKGPSTAYRGSKPRLVEAVRRATRSKRMSMSAKSFSWSPGRGRPSRRRR